MIEEISKVKEYQLVPYIQIIYCNRCRKMIATQRIDKNKKVDSNTSAGMVYCYDVTLSSTADVPAYMNEKHELTLHLCKNCVFPTMNEIYEYNHEKYPDMSIKGELIPYIKTAVKG